eukprot:UN12164
MFLFKNSETLQFVHMLKNRMFFFFGTSFPGSCITYVEDMLNVRKNCFF